MNTKKVLKVYFFHQKYIYMHLVVSCVFILAPKIYFDLTLTRVADSNTLLILSGN